MWEHTTPNPPNDDQTSDTGRRSYWGTLSCLYPSLEPEKVEIIEEAVWASQRGQYAEAKKILKAILPDNTGNPVTAITFADILESQGLEADRSEVLRRVLNIYPQWEAQQYDELKTLFKNVKTLLSLMHSSAEMRSRGRLDTALQTMSTARTDFENLRHEQATHVEVRCVLEYHRIRDFCQSVSWAETTLPSSLYQHVDFFRSVPRIQHTEPIKLFQKLDIQPELVALCKAFQNKNDHLTALRVAACSLSTSRLSNTDQVITDINYLYRQVKGSANVSALHLTLEIELDLIEFLLENDVPAQKLDGRFQQFSKSRKKLEFVNDQTSTVTLRWLSARLRYKLLRRHEVSATEFLHVASQAHKIGAYLMMFQNITLAGRMFDELSLRSKHILDSRWNIVRTQFLPVVISTIKSESLLAFAILDIGASLTSRGDGKITQKLISSFEKSCLDLNLPFVQQQLAGLAGNSTRDELALNFPGDATKDVCAPSQDEITKSYHYPLPIMHQWTCKRVKRLTMSRDLDLMIRRALHILLLWADHDVFNNRLIPKSLEVEVMLMRRYTKLSTIQSTIAGIREDTVRLQIARFAKSMFGSPLKPSSLKIWCEIFPPIENWLRNNSSDVTEESRHYMLKFLQKTRIRTILEAAEQAEIGTFWYHHYHELLYQERLGLLKLLQNIKSMVCDQGELPDAQLEVLRSTMQLYGRSQKLEDCLVSDEVVEDCLNHWGTDLCRFFRRSGDHFQLYDTLRLQALLACAKYLQSPTIVPEIALDFCERADEAFCTAHYYCVHETRHDTSTTSTPNLSKLYHEHYKLSKQALLVCANAYRSMAVLESSRPSAKEYIRGMFVWVERLEARKLQHDLSIGAEPPQHALRISTTSDDGCSLLKYETTLFSRLEECKGSRNRREIRRLQREIETVRDEMRKSPDLEQLLYAQESHAATQADIQRMVDECQSNVVVIKYITKKEFFDDIFVVVFKQHHEPAIFVVPDVTIQVVEAWFAKNLEANLDGSTSEPEFQFPQSFISSLADLHCLVSPLQQLTQIGDTIIICSSEKLRRIPFHLITLEGCTLLDRNPIAYCPNLSLLLRCQKLAFERRGSSNTEHDPKVVCISPLQTHNDPLIEGQLHILNEVTSSYGPCTDEKQVLESMNDATMVNFQGYSGANSTEALDEYLDLGNRSRSSKKITVQHLLRICLRSAAIVVLVECVGQEDDVRIGLSIPLVSAFMFAGASAVVTTLWDVSKEDCELFVTIFHSFLKEEVGTPSISTQVLQSIDIAAVLQKTTERMRELEDGAELHAGPPAWAAFVLHGYWRTPVNIFATPVEVQPDRRETLDDVIIELPHKFRQSAYEMASLITHHPALQSVVIQSHLEPAVSDVVFRQRLEESLKSFWLRLKDKRYSESDYELSFLFSRIFLAICSDIGKTASKQSLSMVGDDLKGREKGSAACQQCYTFNTDVKVKDEKHSAKIPFRKTSNIVYAAGLLDVKAENKTAWTTTEDVTVSSRKEKAIQTFLLSSGDFLQVLEELHRSVIETGTNERRKLAEWWKSETAQELPQEFYNYTDVNVTTMTEDCVTVLDRMKFLVERYSGERWDWAPLLPPRPHLLHGQTRLKWRCQSCQPSYVDISSELATAVREAVERQLFLDTSANSEARYGLLQCSTNTSFTSRPPGMHETASSILSTASIVNQQPAPTHSRILQKAGWTYQSIDTPISPVTKQPNFYILFCVPARRRLPHVQINTSQCMDDDDFFNQLREDYRRMRGFWRHWFSPRKFSHCSFIKATRYHFDELEKKKVELPLDQEYEYEGKPPPPPPVPPYEPPIGENEWFNRFHKLLVFPKTRAHPVLRRQRVIRRIPKRQREFVTRLFAEDEDLWGIQAEFCFSFSGVFGYLMLVVLGGLAFWVWWLERHPGDWQNAVVPLTTCTALLVMFSLPLGQSFKDLI